MVLKKTLFDDNQFTEKPAEARKEAVPLERLKELEDKIAQTIERVKTLKEEKAMMEKRIRELERLLDEKNQEIELLRSEKNDVRNQIESLLSELEVLEFEKQ
ncbi:MAG: cell division protein ZapB [Nitrospira sp.]|nr:cell division protein ZapB [Nitrospira sp.]